MGNNVVAVKRKAHVAIATAPDMIIPKGTSTPVPCITYAEFDSAENTAKNSFDHKYPLFTSKSTVPKCKGGIPNGSGVKSGSYDGEFKPDPNTNTIKTEVGNQLYHGHSGTINKGNTTAKIYTFTLAGVQPPDCVAALMAQIERLKLKAIAEFDQGATSFAKDIGSGVLESAQSYKDSIATLATDSISTVDKACEWFKKTGMSVLKDPIGQAKAAVAATQDALNSSYKYLDKKAAELKKLVNFASNTSKEDFINILDGMFDALMEGMLNNACVIAEQMAQTIDKPGGVAKYIGQFAGEIAIQAIENAAIATAGSLSGGAAALPLIHAKIARLQKSPVGKMISASIDAFQKVDAIANSSDPLELLNNLKLAGKKRNSNKSNDKKVNTPPPHTSTPPNQKPNQDKPDNGAKPPNNNGRSEGSANGQPNNSPIGCTCAISTSEPDGAKTASTKPPPPKKNHSNPATKKHPVNPVLGCKFLMGEEEIDFHFNSTKPFNWQRIYSSITKEIGWHGQGWSNLYTMRLELKSDDDIVEFTDATGRKITFPNVKLGGSFYSLYEHITLHKSTQGVYRIINSDNSFIEFRHCVKKTYYVTSVQDKYEKGTFLEYSPYKTVPNYLLTASGQYLELHFKGEKNQTRLVSVQHLKPIDYEGLAKSNDPLQAIINKYDPLNRWGLPHSVAARTKAYHQLLKDTGETFIESKFRKTLVTYFYSNDNDLIEIKNQHGDVSRRFEWDRHIMSMHEVPGVFVSRYIYDKYDGTGRVIEQAHPSGAIWKFEYQNNQTVMTESLKISDFAKEYWGAKIVFQIQQTQAQRLASPERKTIYHFNEDRRWTGTTDHYGARTEVVLDQYGNTTEVIDAKGNSIKYLLNSKGQPLSIEDPTGAKTNIIWHTEFAQPIEIIDPLGRSVQLIYDQRGSLIEQIDSAGFSTRLLFTYL